MNSPIKSYLEEYRLRKAKLGIAKSSIQFSKFVFPLLALIVSMEVIFYNSIPVRSHLTAYLLGGACSLIGYIILEWALHRYQFFGNSTGVSFCRFSSIWWWDYGKTYRFNNGSICNKNSIRICFDYIP